MSSSRKPRPRPCWGIEREAAPEPRAGVLWQQLHPRRPSGQELECGERQHWQRHSPQQRRSRDLLQGYVIMGLPSPTYLPPTKSNHRSTDTAVVCRTLSTTVGVFHSKLGKQINLNKSSDPRFMRVREASILRCCSWVLVTHILMGGGHVWGGGIWSHESKCLNWTYTLTQEFKMCTYKVKMYILNQMF